VARTGGAGDIYVRARISLRRSALGLSRTSLAQRIEVSFQQVQRYEAGQPLDAFFPPPEEEAAGRLELQRDIADTSTGRAVAAAFPLIGRGCLRTALSRIAAAPAR